MRYLACLSAAVFLGQAAASALEVGAAVKSVASARREIVALLPSVQRQDLAVALKAAAARGTKVNLIVAYGQVRGGGFLLTVSHGPPTVQTYLFKGPIPQAWLIVDGSWVVSGEALNREGPGRVEVSQDATLIKQLSQWAKVATKNGPTARVNILRIFYGAPVKSPQLRSR